MQPIFALTLLLWLPSRARGFIAQPLCVLQRGFQPSALAAIGTAAFEDELSALRATLALVNGKVAHALGIIDLPQQRADADELEARSASATFWDDAANAEAVLRRLSEHKATIEQAEEWQRSVDDAKVALELAPELVADVAQEAVALIDKLGRSLGPLQVSSSVGKCAHSWAANTMGAARR